jgi:hypothetical protein
MSSLLLGVIRALGDWRQSRSRADGITRKGFAVKDTFATGTFFHLLSIRRVRTRNISCFSGPRRQAKNALHYRRLGLPGTWH